MGGKEGGEKKGLFFNIFLFSSCQFFFLHNQTKNKKTRNAREKWFFFVLYGRGMYFFFCWKGGGDYFFLSKKIKRWKRSKKLRAKARSKKQQKQFIRTRQQAPSFFFFFSCFFQRAFPKREGFAQREKESIGGGGGRKLRGNGC